MKKNVLSWLLIEMAIKIFRLKNHFTQAYTTDSSFIKSKVKIIQNRINSIAIPDKYKGTVIERLLLYGKGLILDYRDVFIDVGKYMKKKPIQSSIYTVLGATTVYCFKHNPSETDFIEQLRLHNANMILVDKSCHNPISSEQLIFLERCYNQKIIRRLNIGVCAFLWIDDYDRALGLYKATCKYTKPDYLSWHKRIVDIGLLGKWWKIDEKMHDYDVNETNL